VLLVMPEKSSDNNTFHLCFSFFCFSNIFSDSVLTVPS
jgi:hypothetical protein